MNAAPERASRACDPETRIGLFEISGATRTELPGFVSHSAHRACGIGRPEIARVSSDPGIDEPIAMQKAGAVSYFSVDGLGSVVATNDPAGTVTHSVVFDAWGNVKAEMGTRTHPFTYTGREVGEAGFHFYRARFYQPTTGRFTQEDPFVIFTAQPYSYGASQPIRWRDPLGLFPDEPAFHPDKDPLGGDWYASTGSVDSYPYSTPACDGNGGVIPWISETEDQAKDRLKCLLDCLFLHEATHVEEVRRTSPLACAGKPRGTVVKPRNLVIHYRSEIRAHRVSLSCVQGKAARPCPKECKAVFESQVTTENALISDYSKALAALERK